MATDIRRSYFPACPPEFEFFPYRVMRAGHIVTAADYLIARDSVPGTELIYAIRGSGWIRSGNAEHPVPAGSVAWLDVRHPHAHWPDKNDPWEVYWCRMDGASIEKTSKALGVSRHPVFQGLRATVEIELFEQLFEELEHLSMSSAATISAIVGQLIDQLFRRRRGELNITAQTMSISDRLARLHESVFRSYNQYWDARRMADELSVSTAHMYRIFNSALGMSPNRWLRSIRIEQARRRLVESNDQIGDIAFQVGYRDQFHFSKDFRALTGISPREFRMQERTNRADA